MDKKLRVDRQTVRPLDNRSLARLRGGLPPADDGTNSTYAPCITFYCDTWKTWPCC